MDSLCTLLVVSVDIVLLHLLLVLSAVAVSSLLLFDLEFDFIDFLISVGVTLVCPVRSYTTTWAHATLAGRDGHNAY